MGQAWVGNGNDKAEVPGRKAERRGCGRAGGRSWVQDINTLTGEGTGTSLRKDQTETAITERYGNTLERTLANTTTLRTLGLYTRGNGVPD